MLFRSDTSFTATIQIFRNLCNLNVEVSCHVESGVGQCTFKLNDDDVIEVVMALPRLESLILGQACSENTCATTVACLLPLSVYCVKMRWLEIHFNTSNIVDDFKNISEDPRLQKLRLLPRCPLSRLNVGQMPLTLDEPGFETVVNGMDDIFPSMRCCTETEGIWTELDGRIAGFREMRALQTGHQ